MADSKSSVIGVNQAIIGALIPPCLKALASSSSATPSQLAPALSALLATGSRPWPYPSAFTTASAGLPLLAIKYLMFSLMAPRSISTSARFSIVNRYFFLYAYEG